MQEVFKSDFYNAAPFHKVLRKCCVLFVKDYFKYKPEVCVVLSLPHNGSLLNILCSVFNCSLGPGSCGIVRMHFLAGWHKSCLKQAFSFALRVRLCPCVNYFVNFMCMCTYVVFLIVI